MKNDGKNPTAIKNPLQILNDLQNGTVYELISKMGTPHKPIFTMKVTANGQIFTGQGSSKKMARYEAANAAIKSFKSEAPVKMGGKASGSPQSNIPPPVLNQMNSKYSRVKLKNGNTVNVVPKNPLELLNELKNGVVYDLVSKTGLTHNPVFNVRISIFDRTYTGQGSSKRMARLKAAIAVLESLIVLRKEVTDSLVERDDNPKQQNDLITAIQLSLGMVDFEVATTEAVTKAKSGPSVIDPITLLYKIFPNSYFGTSTRDPLNPLTFCMTVRVNGTPFLGQGQSKNSAKLAAAKTALAVLCHLSFNTLPYDACSSSSHGSILPQALADRIGQLVTEKYNQLMQDDTENLAKRRILAGFVMTRNLDYHKAEVITVATGNRCIIGEYMSRSGKALNDSHAEILSRRCLIDYLYTQLELYNNSPVANLSIFRKSSRPGQLYSLKEGIQFHLYISISPCGDARVFGPHERDINTTSACDQRDNKGKGLLRSKIEAGEGTIPVSNRNSIQTWDGILAGEKLLTMSCSDKICRWNVLGLQGALLSNIIEPIYLHSLVLGSVFDANHVYRAICGRIEDSIENLPTAFRVNKPKLALISSVEKRNMAKTTNLSINWTIGNQMAETVESTVGAISNQVSSRICKYRFFQRYSALVQQVSDFDDGKLAATYGETKNLATNFQVAKRELFEAFRRQLLGNWLKKPIEQDQFGL